MATNYYASPESEKFVRPVALAIIGTQVLLSFASSATLAASVFGLNLYSAAQHLSAFTAASVLIVAAQIWKLYFQIRKKLSGVLDAKIVWLASAVTAACVISTAVVSITIPYLTVGGPDEVTAAVIAAQFVSVFSTGLFAAKSSMSFAALFEALRATEKARLA
ncbi:hypothetical protein [Lysobacter antibioticus]|uniref:hypothetical protein n=1 Tax=Lysobacter antibioticus TaxID=84531 RepID=UPI00113FD55F|nr:hypothetical protein [Lysobacter antibioticus]